MTKPPGKTPQPSPKDFEEAMSELEQIVHDMEAGKTTLEESLTKFERGTFLIDHCRTLLATAEKKIEELTRAADGSVRVEASAPSAGDEEAASADDSRE